MYFKRDPALSPQQDELVQSLSAQSVEKIDAVLLSQVTWRWRKVAMIVGLAMGALEDRVEGIPDIYYAQRVKLLVARGALEAQGDLARMGYCEVRLRGK
jgi:uncharacterized protein DUF3658